MSGRPSWRRSATCIVEASAVDDIDAANGPLRESTGRGRNDPSPIPESVSRRAVPRCSRTMSFATRKSAPKTAIADVSRHGEAGEVGGATNAMPPSLRNSSTRLFR